MLPWDAVESQNVFVAGAINLAVKAKIERIQSSSVIF